MNFLSLIQKNVHGSIHVCKTNFFDTIRIIIMNNLADQRKNPGSSVFHLKGVIFQDSQHLLRGHDCGFWRPEPPSLSGSSDLFEVRRQLGKISVYGILQNRASKAGSPVCIMAAVQSNLFLQFFQLPRIFTERNRRRMIGNSPEFTQNFCQASLLKKLAVPRIHHQYHIVIRIADHILSEKTVHRETARTLFHPALITVAKLIILHLPGGHALNPVGGHHLLPIPKSLIQHHLADFAGILRADKASPSSLCIASGALFPENLLYSHRIEKPGLQKLEHGNSGTFLNGG